MKNYKMILKDNLVSVTIVSVLNIITSFAMVCAGYSLSFFFIAYEYDGNRTKALCMTFGIVILIWMGAMFFNWLACIAQAKAQQKIKNTLREMVGTKISVQDYAAFTQKDCGNYVSWLINDVDQIYSQSFDSLFSAIENLAAMIFSLIALFMLSWHIGFAAILLLVIISVLPQFTGKWLQKENADRSTALETGTEAYKDVIAGSTIFFLSNLRQRIRERIVHASEEAEKANYRYNRINYTVQIFINAVSLIGQVMLVFVALLAAVMGSAASGAVLSVGNLAGSFFNGAGSFVQAFMTINSARSLWKKFENDGQKSRSKQNLAELHTISLKNVSFAYGEKNVLTDQNYTFNVGSKYVIIGESGSGKTTLTRIMLGLLQGYTGAVYYDDVEQQSISQDSIYKHVAYVDQQVYLFQDTLRFNITLGRNYTDNEIMAVIRKCRLENFVASLPEGLDTLISENGKNLSGGQRQRIALARAFIQKVDFVIVDEGTSALDEANAVEIEAGLLDDPELGVIIITHNLRENLKPGLTDIYSLSQYA